MIESKANKQFKVWMKLKSKKYRDSLGIFLVFGDDIIDIAKRQGALVELVTTNPKTSGLLISKELMRELQPDTPFENMGVCKKVEKRIKSDKILVLDDVQDPSNLGALIRSASAFNFNEVLISNKSADLYHEKTIRSSKGAIFDCYVKRCYLEEEIAVIKKNGYKVLCADAHETNEADKKYQKLALVLGNEGQGVSENVRVLCDFTCHIETSNVESLNVAVAGGILMYLWR